MFNKLLITINIPRIETKYEVFIPANKKIHTIIKLIKKSINELTNGEYQIDESRTLFSLKDGILLDPNIKVIDSNIKNGDEFLLM